jgi:iron complex outermembrane receptor protein
LHFSTAFFHIAQTNLPTVDVIDRDFQTTYGKIISQGLEVNLVGTLSENWDLNANYSWMKAKNRL